MCRESLRSLPPSSSSLMVHTPLRRSLQLDVSSLRLPKDQAVEVDIRPPSQSTIIDRVATVGRRNYRTIAYGIVITCYAIGLMEYLYLRLNVAVSSSNGAVSLSSDGKGKDAFHYIVAVVVFFSIALFQLICFFGLTLSERFLSLMKKRALVHPVPSNISVIINTTIQKTFVCYGMCSLIVCMLIFYMLGIEDSLDVTASTVCTYLFDVFVLLYFLCFPLITLIYHPHIYCTKDIQPTVSSPSRYSVLPGPTASPINQFDAIPPLSPRDLPRPRPYRTITTV
ncbi:hypothetical protein PMAYCL1PPCAC_07210 [Pristionchus mayeri]|uniref:Uncharacterized protein n=1 Tax=Pristionchus mayeri TaxID=1317129 RepID=A0AAN4ZG02_9BILA|nr:hypothetical protein PMAYCL1PPCAC_07210 [Pristionchus mayeri]